MKWSCEGYICALTVWGYILQLGFNYLEQWTLADLKHPYMFAFSDINTLFSVFT